MKKEAKYQSPAFGRYGSSRFGSYRQGRESVDGNLKEGRGGCLQLDKPRLCCVSGIFEKDQETKDENPAGSQNNESEKPEDNGQTLKIDKEKLDACTEDVHRAFLAYNLYAVILAKHGEINLTSKHLAKAAKRIARACMKDIEGLNLDNMKVRITRVKGKGGELNLKIYPDANYEV